MKTNLGSFRNIKGGMYWKEPALKQIETFEALAARLKVEPIVVSTHRSKSIELPVVKLELDGVAFYIRDNFYDYNLCVVSPRPLELTVPQLLEGIHEPHTWEWYLGEITKKRNYSFKYFTDEEMEDPRITRVFKPHEYTGTVMKWEVNGEEKDRWLQRMNNPEWIWKDWGSTRYSWDGTFGPGVLLYPQLHPYMEGISDVVPFGANEPYKKGCKMFALALSNIEQIETMIRRIGGKS